MFEKFKNDLEKMSYAAGVNIGEYFSHMPLQLDDKMIVKGLDDYLKGKMGMSQEDYQTYMKMCQEKVQEAGEAKMKEVADAFDKESKAFLYDNSSKEGVITTDSGLQYIVEKEGDGETPKDNDKVRVHYEGKLVNGAMFDSSIKRGAPAEFSIDQVIPGWTEALKLMKVGSKFKLFIPSELAYGEKGAGQAIPPNAALIFDVELLDIVK